MSVPLRPVSLRALINEFGQVPANLGQWDEVSASAVPEPYHGLLVHEHHMTVTVERHHGGPVKLRILDRHDRGETYARKILLVLESTGAVVQFGIMRFHFRYATAAIREAVREARTPLGRILIEHGVLTRISPEQFFRVVPAKEFMEHFSLAEPLPTYGRVATIFCNEEPAVELLEVVAPEQPDRARAGADRRR